MPLHLSPHNPLPFPFLPPLPATSLPLLSLVPVTPLALPPTLPHLHRTLLIPRTCPLYLAAPLAPRDPSLFSFPSVLPSIPNPSPHLRHLHSETPKSASKRLIHSILPSNRQDRQCCQRGGHREADDGRQAATTSFPREQPRQVKGGSPGKPKGPPEAQGGKAADRKGLQGPYCPAPALPRLLQVLRFSRLSCIEIQGEKGNGGASLKGDVFGMKRGRWGGGKRVGEGQLHQGGEGRGGQVPLPFLHSHAHQQMLVPIKSQPLSVASSADAVLLWENEAAAPCLSCF